MAKDKSKKKSLEVSALPEAAASVPVKADRKKKKRKAAELEAPAQPAAPAAVEEQPALAKPKKARKAQVAEDAVAVDNPSPAEVKKSKKIKLPAVQPEQIIAPLSLETTKKTKKKKKHATGTAAEDGANEITVAALETNIEAQADPAQRPSKKQKKTHAVIGNEGAPASHLSASQWQSKQ